MGQAGWQADPYGRHEVRYFDGTDWTEHVSDRGEQRIDAPDGGVTAPPRPLPSREAITPPATVVVADSVGKRAPANGLRLAVGAGGALLVLGAFLPWIKVSTVFGGLEVAGTDGSNDGWISLAMGAIAVLIVVVSAARAAGILAVLVGAVAAFVGIHDFSKVRDSINAAEAKSAAVHAQVGIGLWLTIVGAAVTIVAGLLLAGRRD